MSNIQLSASFYSGKCGHSDTRFQFTTTEECPDTFGQIVYIVMTYFSKVVVGAVIHVGVNAVHQVMKHFIKCVNVFFCIYIKHSEISENYGYALVLIFSYYCKMQFSPQNLCITLTFPCLSAHVHISVLQWHG
jgi:hypothetical protein